MKGNCRLINVQDTVDGRETTILIQLSTFPDNERIVWPRESKHLIIHQIGGTYDNLEDFNNEWEAGEDQVEKTVICPKCKEPVTYNMPNLGDLVNYTCMEAEDAKTLASTIIELLQEEDLE